MEEVPALAKYVRRYDYVVAKDGSGDFFTVQEAVNAAVGGGKKTISILVRPGVYEEYVSMPESSPRIELVKQTGLRSGITGSHKMFMWHLIRVTECVLSVII